MGRPRHPRARRFARRRLLIVGAAYLVLSPGKPPSRIRVQNLGRAPAGTAAEPQPAKQPLPREQLLYATDCAACHGDKGDGNARPHGSSTPGHAISARPCSAS
jgi:mono/diheme cytochrome c family protein